MAEQTDVILEVRNLSTEFQVREGVLRAVGGVDLTLRQGRTLGIVGESGSGKSVTAQSLMRIVPGRVNVGGEILLHRSKKGHKGEIVDLVQLAPKGKEIRDIRGGEISMIFQEPMKAFSPIHTIGNQIMEAILLHNTDEPKEAKKITLEILTKVGMSNPEQRFDEYPHNLSGGMRQRAMIAMALACNPAILIADEPTTALDVTVQAQVLELINNLKSNIGTSVIFITHDLGVIAEMSDEVAVMYLGKVVEYTDVDTIFHGARHPYTVALLKSIPSVTNLNKKLELIEGNIPVPINLPKGCGFYNRCKFAQDGVCNVDDIPLQQVNEGHFVRCLFPEIVR